ncbi:hypothetical protein [Ilumatobacter sp.]|uniref:hypothetical protein n=1 Tax=Ilumatobacter sp. TaxID=1967498 RepID=UPI003B51BEFE
MPDGTIPVGIALVVAGIATYAFFRVGLLGVGGEEEFKPIASLWFATFALAPGFFLPLEQELGRALSARRAVGEGTRPVVQKVVRLGAVLVAATALAIVLASPLITEVYFDGDWVMLVALVCTFAAYAPAHLARGVCSGSGRFREYALIMGSDGLVRIALCAVLAIVGVTAAGAYGLVIALSPLVAVGYVWRRGALTTDDGPPAEWNEVTPNLGWLLLGSVFAATLLNAGPITATLLSGDADAEKVLVTQFSYGVLLARIPLFLFQAVQAALLPGLSRLAARGELREFRSGLARLLVVVVVVGIVGTLGAFAIGPWAIEVVYQAELSGATLAALALASGTYMMALALAQAVIALKGHALVALGWAVGVGVFVVTTAVASSDLFRRIEIGLLASSVASLIVFALALRLRLADGAAPDRASVVQATAPLD